MLLYFEKIKRNFENFITNFWKYTKFKQNLKNIQEGFIKGF